MCFFAILRFWNWLVVFELAFLSQRGSYSPILLLLPVRPFKIKVHPHKICIFNFILGDNFSCNYCICILDFLRNWSCVCSNLIFYVAFQINTWFHWQLWEVLESNLFGSSCLPLVKGERWMSWSCKLLSTISSLYNLVIYAIVLTALFSAFHT